MFKIANFLLMLVVFSFININITNAALFSSENIKSSDNNSGLYGFYLGQTFHDIINNAAAHGYNEIEIYSDVDLVKNYDNMNILTKKIQDMIGSINRNLKVEVSKFQSINNYIDFYVLDKLDTNKFQHIKDMLSTAYYYYNSLFEKGQTQELKYQLTHIVIGSHLDKDKPVISIDTIGDYNDIVNSRSIYIRYQYNSLNESKEKSLIEILSQRFKNLKSINYGGNIYYSHDNGMYLQTTSSYGKISSIIIMNPEQIKRYIDYYISLKERAKKEDENKSKVLDGI